MTPSLPINISIVSENTQFIRRIKSRGIIGTSGIVFTISGCIDIPTDIFLVDAELLENFLKDKVGSTGLKFIVMGDHKAVKPSFDAGCIDFLKIPFDMDELEIRILKTYSFPGAEMLWNRIVITSTAISLYRESAFITLEEYTVLKTLIRNRGAAVPREVLSFALWGAHKTGSRAVDMHISNLRKKIHTIQNNYTRKDEQIITVRSCGYMVF